MYNKGKNNNHSKMEWQDFSSFNFEPNSFKKPCTDKGKFNNRTKMEWQDFNYFNFELNSLKKPWLNVEW